MKHIGTQTIETQRLVLRRIGIDDANAMFCNWANDDDVTKHLTWKSHQSIEDTRTIIRIWENEQENNDCYRWCMELKETHYVIGCIDVVQIKEHLECAVIGYCMSKKYWNRGLMTEALIAVVKFLFEEVGFNRIEAYHHSENPASGKVMAKAGMVYEGTHRQGAKDNTGRYCDLATYAILYSDWVQSIK